MLPICLEMLRCLWSSFVWVYPYTRRDQMERQLGSKVDGQSWRAALALKEMHRMGFSKDADKPWDVYSNNPLLRSMNFIDHTGKQSTEMFKFVLDKVEVFPDICTGGRGSGSGESIFHHALGK